MLDNTNTSEPGMMAGQPILEGTHVFDAAGEKVGSVSEHNVQGGYLVVHKGMIFPRDMYIPLSAIGRSDANGVYLNMYKDELKNQNWENPPENAGMAGPLDSGTTVPTNQANAAQPMNATGTTPDMGQPGTHPTPVRDGDVSVPVREEELIAQKQRGEAGRVHISKDVVEEPQTLNVPVTREQVSVERVPVANPLQGQGSPLGPDAFQERDIEVPVMGEEVTAEKRAKVGEEIHLHKQQVTEQERFGDTVRKERVNVEGVDQQGDVPLAGSEDQPPANP